MRWRLVGPFRGGRTLTATGVPGHPNLFYFGAVAPIEPIGSESKIGSLNPKNLRPARIDELKSHP